jgi:hypothetical protein
MCASPSREAAVALVGVCERAFREHVLNRCESSMARCKRAWVGMSLLQTSSLTTLRELTDHPLIPSHAHNSCYSHPPHSGTEHIQPTHPPCPVSPHPPATSNQTTHPALSRPTRPTHPTNTPTRPCLAPPTQRTCCVEVAVCKRPKCIEVALVGVTTANASVAEHGGVVPNQHAVEV